MIMIVRGLECIWRTRMTMILHNNNNNNNNNDNIPVYILTHSLGGKLYSIYHAATNGIDGVEGIGMISFNNDGLSKSISMAKVFAENLGIGGSGSTTNVGLNKVFEFAQQAIGFVGLEFSPTPSDTERLMRMKLVDQASSWQEKTRLFVLEEDALDGSRDVYNMFGGKLAVSRVPGTHLTPVYWKFNVDGLPQEAKTILSEASSFRGASFGNEEELDGLVEEVCNWIEGKEPSQIPSWASSSCPPRLTTSSSYTE
mmetsp:Transcript_20263/g.30831  ORF Transcript_20263/g.30831 Transcript_20263/m.30831 type:complete len:255 (+) Transcript_20263:254-1018(+)